MADCKRANSDSGGKSHDLFKLLLPTDNPRVLKGKAPLWEKHFRQHKQQQLASTAPMRPQPGRKAGAPPTSSLVSPRQKWAGADPPLSARQPRSRPPPPVSASLARVKSAGPVRPHSAVTSGSSSKHNGRQHLRPSSSPGNRRAEPELRAVSESPHSTRASESDPQYLVPINTHAREHMEIKACLLAHTHHLDVDELQRIRSNNQLAFSRLKMQRIISRGGAFDDGSAHEDAKRKTTFLLRHFFALHDAGSQPQNQLLYDVVEDWACGDQPTSDEISNLWRSIDNHIERSYLLRQKLVVKGDPDEVSVVIALDCLKKLPERLPEYRRVLDVIITILESGLCMDSLTQAPSISPDESSRDCSHLLAKRKRFYFEEYRTLVAVVHDAEVRRSELATSAALNHGEWHTTSSSLPLRLQIERLLGQLADDEPQDKEEIFRFFLRTNQDILSSLACDEVLQYFLSHENIETKNSFYALLMKKLGAAELARLLSEISKVRSKELGVFLFDNLDALDTALLQAQTPTSATQENEQPSQTLFQRLIDRHPAEFTTILWRSPYLTSHIFQGSRDLVARVLEQNVYRISQVLVQRSDVLLTLLNHTLKDSTTVIEEFLLGHPRGLADLLLNRASSIAAIVKSKPYILADLLQACRPTLTKVLASTPEVLSYVIRTTPQALPEVVREDPNILPSVFSLVPHCLGDMLEKHPEFFVDVAHRRPALVSRLFADHPDLLLEPLECNPALFTNFLVYHRKLIPDLSDPDFDPSIFKLQTKKMADSSVQTGRTLNRAQGKLRICEKLRQQREELLEHLKEAGNKETTLIPTLPDGPAGETESEVRKPCSRVADSVLSPAQVVSQIARMYLAKIAADAQDDLVNRKRQTLAEFVLDTFVLDLGFKKLAQKKLLNLLLGAKEAAEAPEAVRIKWFRRFMNAIPGDRPLPRTALDFYLLVLQRLIPSDELQLRLEEEPYDSCLISHESLKTLVDDPLVNRLFESKEQRQRVLALQSSVDAGGVATQSNARVSEASSAHGKLVTLARRTTPSAPVVQLDDLLDVVMKVWVQHQQRVREEWAKLFLQISAEGTGVAHIDAFAALVRSKLPSIEPRALMKVYHSCGEENEMGDFALHSEDFTLTMCILQEQQALSQHASASTSALDTHD